MFKVSFNLPDVSAKDVQTYQDGKLTIVTLRGIVDCPKFVDALPDSIHKWIDANQHVRFNLEDGYIRTVGKAKRAADDSDDPVFAVRLAEARAKLYLYRFMANFAMRLIEYFKVAIGEIPDFDLMYANPESLIDFDIDYNDSIMGAADKYQTLALRELNHIDELERNKFGNDAVDGLNSKSKNKH